MHRHSLIFVTVFCGLLIVCAMADAFECNVCHSKDPAMVGMHKATQAKGIGCFDCHKVGEKLMGKGRPKDRESLVKWQGADPACVGCHGKPD